jgi:outer membrane protein
VNTVVRGAVAVAVCTGAIAAQAPAVSPADSMRTIALRDAVALAQLNAPAAVQARGLLRTSESAVRATIGSFIPDLTFSLSQTQQTGQRFDAVRNQIVSATQPWSYRAGLGSSVQLFDGGRRFAQLRANRAVVTAAEANETSEAYNIALQVKTAYASVLAARESEAAARAELQQAEAQRQTSIARVRAGVATVSDSLRSEIQVGNARLALRTAQNSVLVASASLTRLVGADSLVTARGSDTLDLAPIALDSATLAGLALTGPAVQEARLQLRAAEAGVTSARSGYLPTLQLSYSYNGQGTNPYGFSGDTTRQFLYGSALSLSLNFPIFNNFSREDQVLRARVAEDNASAQMRDARLAAQQSLIQQFGAMRTAEERIQIQQASVLAAEEDLRVQQQRYTLGASTLLDVLTSQSQLNQARAALIQARQDYRIARAQIEAIVGRDLSQSQP